MPDVLKTLILIAIAALTNIAAGSDAYYYLDIGTPRPQE